MLQKCALLEVQHKAVVKNSLNLDLDSDFWPDSMNMDPKHCYPLRRRNLCSGDHVEQARPPGLLGQQPPRPPRLGGHYRLWGWPPLGLWCLSVGAAGGGSTAPPPLLCSHRGRTGLLLLPRPIVPDIKPPIIGTAKRIGFNWSFLKYNDVSDLHWFYAHPDSALYLDANPDWYIIHGFRNEGQTCK